MISVHLFSKYMMDEDIGLIFQILDRSRPDPVAQDYSLTFPMRHVAPGLSLHFLPSPISECQTKYSTCQKCMQNYYNPEERYCYWCHQNQMCQNIYEKCTRFVMGNTTQYHCNSTKSPNNVHWIHQNNFKLAGFFKSNY